MRRYRKPLVLTALVLSTALGPLREPGAAAPVRRGLCAAAGGATATRPLAVLSAFPAELVPLVAAADIEQVVDVDGRQYHLGRLEGVRVVLALTGIGMVNAAQTTETVIRSFAPAGIVMSGVAGSWRRIGDVVVAKRWVEGDRRRVFHTNPALLELVRLSTPGTTLPFRKCTPVPPTEPDAPLVCLPHDPEITIERQGESEDPFNGQAFPCVPGSGDVFGCELPDSPAASARLATRPASSQPPDVEDMESAAVARVAARHHVPFLAVRAVSDGAGDPLGDRGFPAQFFDYYRLAAENAAVTTRALLANLQAVAGTSSGNGSRRRICRLLAKRRWSRAAKRVRAVVVGRLARGEMRRVPSPAR